MDNPNPIQDALTALRSARAAFRSARKPTLADDVDQIIKEVEAEIEEELPYSRTDYLNERKLREWEATQ